MAIETDLVFNAPLGTNGNDIVNGLTGTTSSVSFVTDTGFTAADFAAASAGISYGIDSAQGPAVLGTSDFTLSGWVKPATPVTPGAIIIGTTISGASSPQYSGYQLRLNGTNLEFMIGGGGANEIPVSSSITFSAWHHVAVTRSGTAIVLYIDGAVVDTATAGSVYDTANSWSGHFLTSGMTTDGISYLYGFNGIISDTAMWKRALSGTEITDIYNAGSSKLSSLLPGPLELKGSFASLVHNAATNAVSVEGSFGSLVHSVPAPTLAYEGAWGSLVHLADPDSLSLEGVFGSLTHTVPSPQAICPNISGPPLVPATFNGSASVLPTFYHWSWVSVPGGSTIANAPVPLPDGGVTTPVDMTNNVGLWHFETINSISTPTGSIGLIDTYGDGWHGNNFVSVSVGGVAVLTNITLPSGAGPLWFNFAASLGVGVSVSFTGGTYPTECKYDLNDAPNGTGTTFYNSPTNPTVTYNFTAGSYSSLTTFSTPDTSGGGRTLAVNGATQVAGYVGTYALRFDGTNDYLDYTSTDVFPGTTNAISIAFWQNGTVGLGDNSILRANDASGNRVFNIHMPFSGSIYWDCGNSGTSSYDRINKAAVAGDYSGSWNHWVFTKNVTSGEMKIYLNGVLWHSGSGLTRTLSAITNFYVGCESPSTLLYDGDLDELAVWAREISAAEVANIYALQSGSLAGGSPTLTFTPDIVGIYTINLAINATDNVNAIATIATPTPGGGGAGGQGQSLQGVNLEGMLLQGVILQGD